MMQAFHQDHMQHSFSLAHSTSFILTCIRACVVLPSNSSPNWRIGTTLTFLSSVAAESRPLVRAYDSKDDCMQIICTSCREDAALCACIYSMVICGGAHVQVAHTQETSVLAHFMFGYLHLHVPRLMHSLFSCAYWCNGGISIRVLQLTCRLEHIQNLANERGLPCHAHDKQRAVS
jgi:hypothetical protein